MPLRHLLTSAATAALILASPAVLGAEAKSVLPVAVRSVEDLKAVFATVESVRQGKARARIGGTLGDIAVKEGDRVDAGQVIATVRDPKLALQIAAADARLASLAAQRHQAEVELERARQLRATGSGTQQRLDDAQTGLDVVIGQIAAAKAERALLEQQTREGDILAPTAGRVLQVPFVGSAVIQPGEVAATIATETYVLRLRLPERHARFIHPGDPVLVGARGLTPMEADGDLKRGTVRLVYPELENGQVVADAEVEDLGDYFVGERVRVLVSSGTRPVVVVPPAFLTRRSGVDFATLQGGAEVPVQAGREVPALGNDPGGVEILSGLAAGDLLVRPEGGR
jgi:membrane fusion protein, multidrug efflux system